MDNQIDKGKFISFIFLIKNSKETYFRVLIYHVSVIFKERVMVTKEDIENISSQINWIAKDSEEFFREFNERLTLVEIRYGIKAGFDPSQPRVPAGEPDGGQWTGDSGGGAVFNNPKEPKLPNLRVPREEHFNRTNVITVLSAIPSFRAASSIIKAAKIWRGAAATLDMRTLRIMKNLEKYFGGKPKTFFNTKGDLIMIKGNKKIRFDIENPYPHKEPHFHILHKTPKGNWRNTGKNRYKFKGTDNEVDF